MSSPCLKRAKNTCLRRVQSVSKAFIICRIELRSPFTADSKSTPPVTLVDRSRYRAAASRSIQKAAMGRSWHKITRKSSRPLCGAFVLRLLALVEALLEDRRTTKTCDGVEKARTAKTHLAYAGAIPMASFPCAVSRNAFMILSLRSFS